MQDDNWDPYEDDDWDGVPNAYATERYKPMDRSTNILISLAMFGPIRMAYCLVWQQGVQQRDRQRRGAHRTGIRGLNGYPI